MGKYTMVFANNFLIDSKGRIAKVFENVKPAEHSAEVLEAVKAL